MKKSDCLSLSVCDGRALSEGGKMGAATICLFGRPAKTRAFIIYKETIKIIMFMILLFCFAPGRGKKEEPVGKTSFQIVYVREGDSIIDIANMYLKEPERWKELTKYNILVSTPTMSLLLVPMNMVKKYLRPAFLIYRKGKVYIKRAQKQSWEKLPSGAKMLCGDLIKTGKSSEVKIKFENGILFLGEKKELLLEKNVFLDPEKFGINGRNK